MVSHSRGGDAWHTKMEYLPHMQKKPHQMAAALFLVLGLGRMSSRQPQYLSDSNGST